MIIGRGVIVNQAGNRCCLTLYRLLFSRQSQSIIARVYYLNEKKILTESYLKNFYVMMRKTAMQALSTVVGGKTKGERNYLKGRQE